MNVFLNYLKNGKTFLITSVLFLFFSLITLLLINPSSTPVYSILIHHVWMNIFFINLTFMGDSFFIILMVVFIIFYLQKTRMKQVKFIEDDAKTGYYFTFDRDLKNRNAQLIKSYKNLKLFQIK
jgi:hypothetical protein